MIDGGKGLAAAIRSVFDGDPFQIARCRQHKERNILDHMAKTEHAWVRRELRAAWKLTRQPQDHRPARCSDIPEQGQWLASVVRDHFAYYAVPGNVRAVNAFRRELSRSWLRALRRRSQRHRLNWERMNRLIARWLPPVRIVHPYPEVRFDART